MKTLIKSLLLVALVALAAPIEARPTYDSAHVFVDSTAFASPAPPTKYCYNGEQVTLADGNELELKFYTSSKGVAFITIKTSASGIRVASGETIVNAHYAWTVSDGKVSPISFTNENTIRVKGTASDVFIITYVTP